LRAEYAILVDMNSYGPSARALATCLAGLAGFVDAVGFLMTGGLFLSFMSGNSTRLAVGLPALTPVAGMAALLIASFVMGVVLGSLAAACWATIRKPLILVLVAGLIALAALLDGAGWMIGRLVPLAMAMGCANNVFQRDGDVTIGVTYMTGALVRFGQRLADAIRGGSRWGWLPYLQLWTGLLAGAVAGALAFARIGSACLWIAAVVAMLLALWARRLPASS
jgi:uncharacterized membrane protein YoaK (UPF0700 family)